MKHGDFGISDEETTKLTEAILGICAGNKGGTCLGALFSALMNFTYHHKIPSEEAIDMLKTGYEIFERKLAEREKEENKS